VVGLVLQRGVFIGLLTCGVLPHKVPPASATSSCLSDADRVFAMARDRKHDDSSVSEIFQTATFMTQVVGRYICPAQKPELAVRFALRNGLYG
jgi:hypothetical protein